MDCRARIAKTRHDEPGFFSVFEYKEKPVHSLLQSLKYKGGRDVAKTCAELLYEHLCEYLGERVLFNKFEKPLVVPIPLHPKRMRERGFNQAELIGRELVKLDASLELSSDMLKRIKNTESQTKMKNRDERIKNVHECFAVHNPEKIKERNIILIDDVYTTGATMNEARAALKKSGAREVLCVTVAH